VVIGLLLQQNANEMARFIEREEITNALETFKGEVAAGAATGYVMGGLIKKDGD
jgi:hypothetical protein